MLLAKYDVLNTISLQNLIAKGTKLVAYSPEILQVAQKAAFANYEENASKESTFKQVYEQWNKFRRNISNWNKTNELSFNSFMAQGNR